MEADLLECSTPDGGIFKPEGIIAGITGARERERCHLSYVKLQGEFDMMKAVGAILYGVVIGQ